MATIIQTDPLGRRPHLQEQEVVAASATDQGLHLNPKEVSPMSFVRQTKSNPKKHKKSLGSGKRKQVALNCSTAFCLKLTYRHLLKAGHVPGDTWGGASFGSFHIIIKFWPQWHNLNKLGRGLLCHATYQKSRLDLCLMVSDKKIFPCFFPL